MSDDVLTLSALRIGQRLRGLVADRAVTLIAVDPVDSALSEVFYRDDAGNSGERAITEADVARLALVNDHDDAPRFDGDPDDFRLAAEALRIKYAALYDPMAAVNSSDVDPLPHQIRAVYEELLPRVPLRFLLADDPGAGKTIMAGLYLKELLLRSDCERAIIVAPGGLADQWREELSSKFDLRFEIFSRQMVDEAQDKNVFAEHPFLIMRMDQASRSEDLLEQLNEVTWDVAIVDEAHRMSAHYSSWSGEVDETKRFKLGRLLSETAHNFLLMTATPHAGKEEDFQLFMSLLDPDRFAGQFRPGVHRTDTTGLMRRMVKEDLLTFEGKPLFPERRANTIEYQLSQGERELYELVTTYVRTEMGRAERISQAGDRKRGNNVGFALTVLQRRLASSPEAILRSLERRQGRLENKLREMRRAADSARYSLTIDEWATGHVQLDLDPTGAGTDLGTDPLQSFDDFDEEVTDEERARFEEQIDQVVDLATAAETVEELRAEIAILEDLVRIARAVRLQDTDRKWVELRSILENSVLTEDDFGSARKIIIFTEHRDTLEYLTERITGLLGQAESVVTIHGGVKREDRKKAQEQFTSNPNTAVLLATDAAGEGLNLQRAHLMVNYDLPWNPNRIEQRFGRIHRIGQREVCHLWNMVAADTREGDVFLRLLEKIDEQGKAYNGNLFNVLGERDAFQDRSLRDLLVEAIRYGDQPEVKARLGQTIDASVAHGLDGILRERALHPEMYPSLNLEEIRAQMERVRERKLQPGYIRAFFIPAFERLGGRVRRREGSRYQITRVPARVQDAARRINRWAPIADEYERITFETSGIRSEGSADATLLAPGNSLLHAVIELTNNDLGAALKQGTIFVDRRERQLSEPTLMYTVEQRIQTGGSEPATVSHHFDYALLGGSGEISVITAPPYLDFDRSEPGEAEAILEVIDSEWVRQSHEKSIRAAAYRQGLQPRMGELVARFEIETERTRRQVKERLLAEINHWDREHNRLEVLERGGTVGRLRAEAARLRARALDERLDRRNAELDQATVLIASPAIVRGSALVVPSSALTAGDAVMPGTFARETERVERRAVEKTLATERALGRTPVEMARNNPGYDIRSVDDDGRVFFIEVKGRVAGADTFTITANEVAYAQTQGDRHRLSLVSVHDDPVQDELRYVLAAFDHLDPSSTTNSLNEIWADYWSRGGTPI